MLSIFRHSSDPYYSTRGGKSCFITILTNSRSTLELSWHISAWTLSLSLLNLLNIGFGKIKNEIHVTAFNFSNWSYNCVDDSCCTRVISVTEGTSLLLNHEHSELSLNIHALFTYTEETLIEQGFFNYHHRRRHHNHHHHQPIIIINFHALYIKLYKWQCFFYSVFRSVKVAGRRENVGRRPRTVTPLNSLSLDTSTSWMSTVIGYARTLHR